MLLIVYISMPLNRMHQSYCNMLIAISFLGKAEGWPASALPSGGSLDGRPDRPSSRWCHVYIYIYIYTCVYVCIYIHICICMYTDNVSLSLYILILLDYLLLYYHTFFMVASVVSSPSRSARPAERRGGADLPACGVE